MQLLLTIPQAGYDAQATVASGVQTGLTFSSQAQSFLFAGAAALKGATITAATLRVRLALGGNLFDWGTTLACEDADNAAPFANGEPFANWTGRPRTPPVEWDLLGSNPITQGQRLDSASIAAAVQQVVDRAGFVDTLQVFWDFDPSAPPRVWHYEQHPTAAAELLIDYLPPASDSVLVEAADAIVATLAAGAFSQAFTPVRSWAQWQRPFEIAEAVGLQVDVVPVSALDNDLSTRKSVKYSPAIDVVVRKKFGPADLEEVPGENAARVKFSQVAELVALLEEIHQALKAKRLGAAGPDLQGNVAWESDRILAAYMPTHLRNHHQYTGVIRLTYAVNVPLV
jgi:hypothetical protein